ncbi:MAG TPA: cupredoxin family copper-binding protein [Longimicrobiales bacterium]
MKLAARVAIGAMLLGIALVAVARADGGARAHVVEMTRFAFQPFQVEVAPGDTVRWLNRELVPHTATARDGSWDSGGIEQGASWSWVADRRGTIDYVCAYHPSMRGRIVVR